MRCGMKQRADSCDLAEVWLVHFQDTAVRIVHFGSWPGFQLSPGWLQSSGVNFGLALS